VKLSADIDPKELRIYRESERNLDVAGNTLISLSLQVDPSKWTDVTAQVKVHRVTKLVVTDKGAFLDPDKITIEAPLEVAPPPCPLQAKVTLLYQLRRPTGNARSYVEGEQNADYINSRVPLTGEGKIIDLVPADAVRPPSWQVFGQNDAKLPLGATDLFSQEQPLDFSTYEQARDFAVWLNQPSVQAWFSKNPAKGLALGTEGLKLAIDPVAQKGPFGAAVFRPFAGDAERNQKCAAMVSKQ
jgi:hypothetical protein